MSQIEKVSIALTPELAEHIREAVRSGDYATASEVVRDALRGWMQRRQRDRTLRGLVEAGLASGEPQDRQPVGEFLKEARARRAKSGAA